MPHLSVILPCLNEADNIAEAIASIEVVLRAHQLHGEIIVVDNGSTDDTAARARQFDIIYVYEPNRGYGRAYQAGLANAQGQILILGDPDGSYDFSEIPRFLEALDAHDVVLGSRFAGEIKPGAMPWLHRYVGNPLMLVLFRLLFNLRLTEPSTGFVVLKRDIVPTLRLREPGMEFSSELLVRCRRHKVSLTELPITYYPRIGYSKLRTFRDGARHAWFLLRERFRSV